MNVTIGGMFANQETVKLQVESISGEQGPQGAPGQDGEDGAPGATPDLSAYATKQYVDQAIAALDALSEVEF